MGFIKFRFIDGLDIVVVTLIIYYFLSFIKGTKAIQMIIGLLSLLLLGLFADFFKLETLSFITKGFSAVWIIVFVILFQPELRNALARIGRTKIGKFFTKEKNVIMDELVSALFTLSKNKHGCIIAIERDTPLKSYMDTGRIIEAKLSSELITTIFSPHSSLHDGAVVIKEDTIVAAACILPLSEKSLNTTIGTRHRAALGLSEETDALCIIVSEETGKISFATGGNLTMNIPENELKSRLLKELG
ncbi:MAG: diadenylate cyclase CdaA [bacterium]|nr:diadenylate cyclase CdaA [bacterium]